MKLNPFRKIAKDALIKWNVLSEEDATKEVETKSFQELNNMTGAASSIKPAIDKLSEVLGLTDDEKLFFENTVYGRGESVYLSEYDEKILKNISEKAKNLETCPMIIDVLSHVHDVWVENYANKFVDPKRVSRKYQHLPLELIGFQEAINDLLFVNPILDAMNIQYDMKDLQTRYYKDVMQYLSDNNIHNREDLIQHIAKGKEMYPALTEGVNEANLEDAAAMADVSTNFIKEAKEALSSESSSSASDSSER